MNKIYVLVSLLLTNSPLFAQSNDTQFVKRITAFSWMPDGKSILLNILKMDRSEKSAPVSAKYRFDINTTNIELLPIDGSGLAASPDGKSVAYIKRVNNHDHIYAYEFVSKQHKPLVSDTLRKFSVGWSPDGNYLIYNTQTGRGPKAEVQICLFNILDQQSAQISKNTGYRSYGPVWNPKNDKIVYYLEKGDQHDQIYLTDAKGSFFANLTNDTTTHNYSPAWLNEHSIIYIQAPDHVMTMNIDGTNRQKIEEVHTTQIKFNSRLMKAAYLNNDGQLILINWAAKTTKVLIDADYLKNLQ